MGWLRKLTCHLSRRSLQAHLETAVAGAQARRTHRFYTYLPAECDVRGHFVNFSLVCQAASVGQEGQPLVVGEYGVVEAFRAPLQSDESLWYVVVGLC